MPLRILECGHDIIEEVIKNQFLIDSVFVQKQVRPTVQAASKAKVKNTVSVRLF